MPARARAAAVAVGLATGFLGWGCDPSTSAPEADAARSMDAETREARDAETGGDAATGDVAESRDAAESVDDAETADASDATACAPGVPRIPRDPATFGPADWQDYLIQDTCRCSGEPVSGDPIACPDHSDLEPGELVHASFKYADASRTWALHSLPRAAPSGVTGFVLFDSGNGVDGKGMFDLDDPHCRVPGSLCYQGGDVDIVDLVEARTDSAWTNVVSAFGTAHLGTGGYIGFTSAGLDGSSGTWPDGWLFGTATGPLAPIPISLYAVTDASGTLAHYVTASHWDKAICSAPLGAPPPPCTALGFNQWLFVDQMYMGLGKTLSQVLVSVHSAGYAALNDCSGHLELYLHSREYGLMSHQTWRRIGCETGPPANIGCTEGEQAMIHSPFGYSVEGTLITLERRACTRAIFNDEEYVFDPRALSQPSMPVPYPSAPVVDAVGYGNLLLNGQFGWRDASVAGWQTRNVAASEVETDLAAAAPYNDAAVVSCTGDCAGASLHQVLDLALRAPSVVGATVDFGARIARLPVSAPGTGVVHLIQLRADLSMVHLDTVRFDARRAWPDPEGDFVTGTAAISAETRYLLFELVPETPSAQYVIDDVFVTRR